MKKIFFISLLISQLSFSQIEKSVGDFNKVTSFDKIDVTLIQSDENKVVLSGSDAEEVELVNKNGELKIRMPLTKILSGENTSATVYFKKIEAIEANEGSTIASEVILKGIAFEVIAKEGSVINLNFEVNNLKTRIASGARVTFEGQATNQDCLINSGAVLDAQKLETTQTTITANAGGEATVFATDFVDAKVRAGGKITIYGKPKQINQKTIAGGTIEEAK